LGTKQGRGGKNVNFQLLLLLLLQVAHCCGLPTRFSGLMPNLV